MWTPTVAAQAASEQASHLEVVALSYGLPGSAIPASQFVRFDESPVVNNRGEVAFLAGAAVSDSDPAGIATSVWLGGRGQLELIAQAGGIATPQGGLELLEFSKPRLNNSGQIAFQARIDSRDGSAPTRDSIWRAQAGNLELTAIASGDDAGGTAARADAPPLFHSFQSNAALNDQGQLAFFAKTQISLPNAAHDGALWLAGQGEMRLAARAGSAPVLDWPAAKLNQQSFDIPFGETAVLDPTGRTVFRGFLEGEGITTANRAGLYAFEASEGLSPLVLAGDEAPGTDGQPFVSFPTVPGVNARGDVAFAAFFGYVEPTADDPGEDLNIGIWVGRESSLRPLVRLGDPAPGIPGDAQFVDVFTPYLNARGHVTMLGVAAGQGVDDGNEAGIWSDGMSKHGMLQLVAREGDQAPGTNADERFNVFLDPTINAHGQTAFMAGLAGPGVSDAAGNVFGLWAQDRQGKLRMIVRAGQSLEVAPGDVRTIRAIAFASGAGGEDGRAQGLNDLGQVAFRLRFTDGTSGVFLSSAASVPEPAGALLLSVGCVVAAWLYGPRRARRR